MSDLDELFGGSWNAADEAANAANAKTDFEPIEAGWYTAIICAPGDGKPMLRDSQTGGKYLSVSFRVTGPKHEGRYVYNNINLVVKPKAPGEAAAKKAQTAESIGRRELAQLCLAAGKPTAHDSAELVDCLLDINVTVGSWNDKPRNEVKAYRPAGGRSSTTVPPTAPKTAQTVAPAKPAPTETKQKLPWM